MNGGEVLLFTMNNVPKGTKKLLENANISIDEIDYFRFIKQVRLL